MANDRVYLVCKNCNRGRLLMKYYPDGSFVPHTSDALGDFMHAHLNACHFFFGNTLESDPKFWLATEADYGRFEALAPEDLGIAGD